MDKFSPCCINISKQIVKDIAYFVIGERAQVEVEKNQNEAEGIIIDDAVEPVVTHVGLFTLLELVLNLDPICNIVSPLCDGIYHL